MKATGQKHQTDRDVQLWCRPLKASANPAKNSGMNMTCQSCPHQAQMAKPLCFCFTQLRGVRCPRRHSVRGGSSVLKEVPGRLSANHTNAAEADIFSSGEIWAVSPCPPWPPIKDIKTHTIWYRFYLSSNKDFLRME